MSIILCVLTANANAAWPLPSSLLLWPMNRSSNGFNCDQKLCGFSCCGFMYPEEQCAACDTSYECHPGARCYARGLHSLFPPPGAPPPPIPPLAIGLEAQHHHLWFLSVPVSLTLLYLVPLLLAAVLVRMSGGHSSGDDLSDRRRWLFARLYLPLRGVPMMVASRPFFTRGYDPIRPRMTPAFYPYNPQLAAEAMPFIWLGFCAVGVSFVVAEACGVYGVSRLVSAFYVTVTGVLVLFEESLLGPFAIEDVSFFLGIACGSIARSDWCIRRLFHASFYLLLTTYYLLLATYHLLPTTYYVLLTTYYLLPTTYY